MSKHYVALPALRYHKRVSLGAYVRAWRLAKAHPERTFSTSLRFDSPSTGAQVLQEFREGMHDRINTRGGITTAYKPRLFAHRYRHQPWHPPDVHLLAMIARHRNFTCEQAADRLLDLHDYQSVSAAVDDAIANKWFRVRRTRHGAELRLTRRGKRALSKRIRVLAAMH